MTWVILSFAFSLLVAAQVECNRLFQKDPVLLNLWRSVFGIALLLCLSPFAEFPKELGFYIVAVIDGLFCVLAFNVLFALAARKSGRVSSMFLPVATFTAFILYFFFAPETFFALLGNIPDLIVILACFAVAFIAIQTIRRNDSGWRNFLVVIPVGLGFGFTDCLMKSVFLPSYSLFPVSITFALVSFTVSTVTLIGLVILRRYKPQKIMEKSLVKSGAITSVISCGVLLCLLSALALAPSPAYPGFIGLLVPVWLLIYHKIIRVRDDANPYAGMALVAAAMGIIFVTNF